MSEKIKLIVVDDHPIVRKGITAMLSTEENFDVLAECKNGEEAVECSLKLRPDVILMDLVMPKKDGVQAIQDILAQAPGTRILVLTSFGSEDKVIASINAGAKGYLLKDSDPEILVRAIHSVYRGETSLDPTAAKHLVDQLISPKKEETGLEQLTERELEVLKYIARGMSNQEIAEIMVISKATVHSHVNKVLSKLGLTSRTQAALFAIKKGLVEI